MKKSTKVLDLSRAEDDESSTGASSSDEENHELSPVQKRGSDDAEESSEEEDDEFEIPEGFDGVAGSSSITRESVLPSNKQLWLFKLPKDVDASALAGTSFKLSKKARAGQVATSVVHDGKTYRLQHEDAVLSHQLVNAFPEAKNRHKFVLGKPFSRCFSLLADPLADVGTTERTSTPKSKKTKRDATPDKKSHKKSKHKAL